MSDNFSVRNSFSRHIVELSKFLNLMDTSRIFTRGHIKLPLESWTESWTESWLQDIQKTSIFWLDQFNLISDFDLPRSWPRMFLGLLLGFPAKGLELDLSGVASCFSPGNYSLKIIQKDFKRHRKTPFFLRKKNQK